MKDLTKEMKILKNHQIISNNVTRTERSKILSVAK